MKKFFFLLTLMIACGLDVQHVYGQTAPAQDAAKPADPGITATFVVGEVTNLDAAAKGMTVKTDAGSLITVLLDNKTAYLRLPATEKTLSLDKTVPITLSEVSVGDRVIAQGRVAEDRKTVPAPRLVVLTKGDITQKQESERAEWRRRGIAGTISALNPATKEITVSARSGFGTEQAVTIDASADKVVFRRYAPGSVRYEDTKLSSFNELKVGDQVRALGNRSEDGARFTPEQIVSGAFRQVVGTVTAVDPTKNEFKINNIETRQPLTVMVSNDSQLKRMPPEMVARFAQAGQGGPGGGPPGGPRSMQGPPPGGGQGRQPGGEGGAAGPGGGPGRRAGVMGGNGGPDLQDMFERLPATTLAELKPGDMIVVLTTASSEPSRATAVKLLAGMDAVIKNVMQRAGAGGPSGRMGGGVGSIDFGIGLP